MRNRKRAKTIDDISVSQLLDDFIKLSGQDSGKSATEIDDEEYIKMMLKKDAQRQLERKKRASHTTAQAKIARPKDDTIDEGVRKRFFPDVSVPPIKKEVPPEPLSDNGIVEQILDSIVVKDVSGLATKMREAVDSLQEEMGTSESERRLVAALEDYSKERKKPEPVFSNDNILVLKRCQNCYFCVGEKNRNGSVWCLCTNPDRSTSVELDDSWVKSQLNLPCWNAPQD